MTWLTTWAVYGTPRYAEHPSEAAAEQDARTKRAAGFEAVEFWSEAS